MINHIKGFSQFINESDTEQVSGAEGRNNPEWINLVSKLRTLSYAPKILTFNSSDGVPMQSLNWGTTKGQRGNYAFGCICGDEELDLFNSDDRKNQADMHNWWKSKGYTSDGHNTIFVDFKNADKLRSDIESFFKLYPPE